MEPLKIGLKDFHPWIFNMVSEMNIKQSRAKDKWYGSFGHRDLYHYRTTRISLKMKKNPKSDY